MPLLQQNDNNSDTSSGSDVLVSLVEILVSYKISLKQHNRDIVRTFAPTVNTIALEKCYKRTRLQCSKTLQCIFKVVSEKSTGTGILKTKTDKLPTIH